MAYTIRTGSRLDFKVNKQEKWDYFIGCDAFVTTDDLWTLCTALRHTQGKCHTMKLVCKLQKIGKYKKWIITSSWFTRHRRLLINWCVVPSGWTFKSVPRPKKNEIWFLKLLSSKDKSMSHTGEPPSSSDFKLLGTKLTEFSPI